jgi:hypothetical protein
MGKARLIRAILGELSRRKGEGEHAFALYTGDMLPGLFFRTIARSSSSMDTSAAAVPGAAKNLLVFPAQTRRVRCRLH